MLSFPGSFRKRRYFAVSLHGAGCPFQSGFISLLLALFAAQPLLADRIILRNLDILSDPKVVAFDYDGVRLANGKTITWDTIESGRVAEDQQAEFDRILQEVGGHLYRLRRRLAIGDYAGLLTHAEAVFPKYATRRSPTAYIVFQSLMWARLAVGQREAALEPYLLCLEYLHTTGQTGSSVSLPGQRRLRVDVKTGLSPELPPIWFDAKQAKQFLPAVARVIQQMTKPRPPAVRIYYATLALSAGRPKLSAQVLQDLHSLESLKQIVQAESEFLANRPAAASDLLADRWKQFPADRQPLALYWLGRARLALDGPDVHRRGLLDLLRIAAVYGGQHPDVAAAGLYEVMRQLAREGNISGSIAVRRELLDHYSQTWQAMQLRKDTKTTKAKP